MSSSSKHRGKSGRHSSSSNNNNNNNNNKQQQPAAAPSVDRTNAGVTRKSNASPPDNSVLLLTGSDLDISDCARYKKKKSPLCFFFIFIYTIGDRILQGVPVELDEDVLKRVGASRDVLEQCIARGDVFAGISGPQTPFHGKAASIHQADAVARRATTLDNKRGAHLPPPLARLAAVIQLNGFCRGQVNI
jgi:hypothetical protein